MLGNDTGALTSYDVGERHRVQVVKQISRSNKRRIVWSSSPPSSKFGEGFIWPCASSPTMSISICHDQTSTWWKSCFMSSSRVKYLPIAVARRARKWLLTERERRTSCRKCYSYCCYRKRNSDTPQEFQFNCHPEKNVLRRGGVLFGTAFGIFSLQKGF